MIRTMKKHFLSIIFVLALFPAFASVSNVFYNGEKKATAAKHRAPCSNFKDIEIPNVFTPNNDGKNDIFYLEGWDVCIQTFEMLIYDRWGVKIFESTNVNVDWDGRLLSGTEAIDGTYYYIFNITNVNGEEEKISGFITLFR